jgi:V/A-type H+-transporting ATPase subunit F
LIGLRLSGIAGELVQDREAALEMLHRKLSDPEIGIVVLSSGILHMIEKEVMEIKLKEKKKMIVEVPAVGGKYDSGYITRYIRDSIGIKL